MAIARCSKRRARTVWAAAVDEPPCWPSFVWQTYDYYLEPTAAYFGCKKGSEPLHIQWNPVTENIEVVNYSGGSHRRG